MHKRTESLFPTLQGMAHVCINVKTCVHIRHVHVKYGNIKCVTCSIIRMKGVLSVSFFSSELSMDHVSA